MKNKYCKPTISEWGDLGLNNFAKPLEKTINNILNIALDSDKNTIYFPILWNEGGKGSDGCGGEEITDPLTIYLILGELGGQEGDPIYEINLKDALIDDIDTCTTDGSFSYGFGRLSTALRKLADEIDEARKSKKISFVNK